MTAKVEIIAIGDDLGIILPDEALQHLGVQPGDTLSVVKVAGGFELKPLKMPEEAAEKPRFA